ncbi:MAG: SpoIIE family protein phosphatase [Rubrobacter sp.]|nr:SpoIIE family protein phosphatase [Rubrobacter sp.]
MEDGGPDLHATLDHLPDPFVAVDGEWRFTYVNPAAASILGGGDLVGKLVWDRFPGASGSEFNKKLLSAMETREPFDMLLKPREFGLDTDAWFNLRAYPVPGGLAAIAWDATAAKESEEERDELLRAKTEIARVLQRALLPPSLPSIPGAEVGAKYVAAGEGVEVGGDFYDVFAMEDDGWALVIGDVAGKGPEAASLTSLARHTIRAAAMRVKRPKRVLSTLNDEILRQTGGERLFTAVYGELEPHLGGEGAMELRVACAGHPSPLILRKGGEVERLPETGTILGVLEDPEFSYCEVTVKRGEAVVFYTDGVIEARSEDGSFFGEERLSEVASGCGGLSARDVAARIEAAALDFQNGVARDDIAVLVLRVEA